MQFFRITLLFISVALNSIIYSQNVIINGDFEKIENNSLFECTNISGTPDVYNSNSKPIISPAAKLGLNCIGLAFGTNWSEAIQLHLKEPLKKDAQYKLSISVTRPKFCPTGLKTITCAFMNYPFKENQQTIPLNFAHLKLYKQDSSLISNSDNWTILHTIYTATGSEKYLILGNIGNANSDIIKFNKDTILNSNVKFGCNYFFYDDVELTEFKQKVIVKNIHFKLNSSIIENKSFADLNYVLETLKQHNYSKIRIVGNTDNTGTDDENMKLSLKRAESVRDYFIKMGINRNIVSVEGAGSSNPLNQNSNEQERAANRRVEFFIELK